MANRKVVLPIEIQFDDKGAISKMRQLKEETEQLPTAAGKATSGIAKLQGALLAAGGAMVALVAAKAASELAKFAKESVAASIAQQRAFQELASATGRVGVSYRSVQGDLDGVFRAIQRTTTAGDDLSAKTLTRLINTTGSYDNALKLLTPTIDFAAA